MFVDNESNCNGCYISLNSQNNGKVGCISQLFSNITGGKAHPSIDVFTLVFEIGDTPLSMCSEASACTLLIR